MDEYDREKARAYMVLIVIVVTVLMTLVMTQDGYGQEPVRFRMTCAPLSNNDMEHKTCGIFYKRLKKHDKLEPAEKDYDGTFMWYIVSPGYHEAITETQDIPVTFNIMALSCLKPMAGLCFSVWISGDMVTPNMVPIRAELLVNQSVNVYGEWLDNAADVFKNMCPDPECPEGTVFEQWTKSLISVSTTIAHQDGYASDIQQHQSK